MKATILFLAFIGILAPMFQPNSRHQLLPEPRIQTRFAEPLVANETKILSSTVQIKIFAPALDEGGQQQLRDKDDRKLYRTKTGLGTLVNHGGSSFIITHNHWDILGPHLSHVEISDILDHELLTVDGAEFWRSIRHRDPGTLILEAPIDLAGTSTIAIDPQVEPGTVVGVTYRQPETGQIRLVPAVVERISSYRELPSFHLRTLAGEVVAHGNSGGGIWLNDMLVSNVWLSIHHETVRTYAGVIAFTTSQGDLIIAPQIPAQALAAE